GFGARFGGRVDASPAGRDLESQESQSTKNKQIHFFHDDLLGITKRDSTRSCCDGRRSGGRLRSCRASPLLAGVFDRKVCDCWLNAVGSPVCTRGSLNAENSLRVCGCVCLRTTTSVQWLADFRRFSGSTGDGVSSPALSPLDPRTPSVPRQSRMRY